ncbi:unnamed protein product [Hymenolepis diminuta]|uniref:DZF domain-containing protein n=1 Tax=Hymenolepis diminuta TaxID=6216 RepID=A0A564YX47_HYMDI|nr:unnamed protein product [Hymenolepis diminuta]
MKGSKYWESYCWSSNYALPLSYTPFDPVYCSCIFPGVCPPPENEELSACLMEILSRITPSADEMVAVGTLTARVIEGLESLALGKSTANFGIQGASLVGSSKKGTMLDGHKIADVVVLLRDLPTIELTRQIGQVFTEKLGGCETIYQPYGFDVEQEGVCVRVVFAVKNFDEISNVQQGVHVSQPDQKLAHFAILHARWAEQNASHPNIKALIRLLKDLRRRFVGFSYLNPWQLDMIASHVIMGGPINAPLSVSAGFRRFVQILAAGFFAPSSTGLLDPFRSKQRRVHVTMSLAQQDELCRTAQTVCKILNLEKFQVLFYNMCPTKLITLEELVKSANDLPGEKISLPNPIDLELSSVTIIHKNNLPIN